MPISVLQVDVLLLCPYNKTNACKTRTDEYVQSGTRTIAPVGTLSEG